jgi:hypothetical protein
VNHEGMLTLSSDAIQALPVDERGLTVLKDLLEVDEWNEYNYLLRYKQSPGAASAIAESLAWLRGRAFIARVPGNSSDAAIFVTSRGREALVKGLATVRAVEHLEAGLHPMLEQRVRRQFLLGEYEQAVFVAMKAVEVRVRSLAGLGDDVIGVALMTKAFNTDGPLTDTAAVPGERVGTMNLFQGAYAPESMERGCLRVQDRQWRFRTLARGHGLSNDISVRMSWADAPHPRTLPPGLDPGQSSVAARYIPGTPEVHGRGIPCACSHPVPGHSGALRLFSLREGLRVPGWRKAATDVGPAATRRWRPEGSAVALPDPAGCRGLRACVR